MGGVCCSESNEGGEVTSVVATTPVTQLSKDKLEPLPSAPKKEVVIDTPKQPAYLGFPESAAPPNQRGLMLSFEDEFGIEKVVAFPKKPLGIDFCKAIPVTVKRTHPSGQAEGFGIQPGWKLMKVNTTEIEGKSLTQIHEILMSAALELPH
mmetsp:Transcript_29787/g.64464  ORF Transcript_29787/g.64464 Transcript_29787/m.64464 type:complete len:151 (-) Transcript_29787:238-690(-)|eukprot:CAMPEP_0206458706 /NCGR_PEP_ID=MMETSP0324_2-20121206/23729_1 /ASSEMBLY_ACC=CAM_ASM_000836 /TAXON_ID=2866 /ORGANISM="Crypthecodinium cohnii, Strain Seligo" /LENGTH=150 /DNA_ID=CAMNT_0053930095 /DNA_START=254 /DNA_END=706 /DNA_ORIENTATION=-